MRLQLIAIITFFSISAFGQSTVEIKKDTLAAGKTEIDFLFSYYHQEGDNSAVQGGRGTEKLTDVASTVIVNIPTTPIRDFIFEYNISYYTSASSDNINPTTISSASSDNLVNHINLTKIYKDTAHHSQTGFKLGITHQNNFGGFSLGGLYSKQSQNNNRELKIQGSFTLDKWALYYPISKLYPVELKGHGDLVNTDKRYSYNVSLAYKQIVTKRLQIQVATEMIYQTGLLSTPFHRVYFQGQDVAKLEKLPSHRMRIPFTFRVNYYAMDHLIVRSLYRYYIDDFGITSHTFNIELPVKLTNFFSLYPFYNFHTQTASTYFQPYHEHSVNELYYTSDYDLSQLNSYEIGGGFYYAPVYNIATFKRKKNYWFALKKWETRIASYRRSTKLHAVIISTHLGFVF